jgi:hypothetical protein
MFNSVPFTITNIVAMILLLVAIGLQLAEMNEYQMLFFAGG